jgi:choline dehydrogenase-like flavoprotein
MILDGRTLPDGETIRTDVCVIGAGPAGIALALEFAGEEFEVVLLESGGLDPDEPTLLLGKSENVGFPYKRLDGARFRAFGGNSRTWNLDLGEGIQGTRLRAMDPIDFEAKEWVPYSGWPFDHAHLQPYYERAHQRFEIGPVDYDPRSWEDPESRPSLPFRGDRVQTTIFQFGRGDLFFEDYRRDIGRSGNLTALLHSNVTELETDENGSRVIRAHAQCLAGGTSVLIPAGSGLQRMPVEPLPEKRFSVEARIFVLAAGGTENPRLLLLSDRDHPGGLGNRHDLVGRFFMEHPHLWSGELIPNDPEIFDRIGLYRIHRANGVPVMAKLILGEETVRQEKILNYCVSIHPDDGRRGVRSFWKIVRAIRHRRRLVNVRRHLMNVAAQLDEVAVSALGRVKKRLGGEWSPPDPGPAVFRLNHMSEQAPNPESRVTLSEERDALGLPRVRLDWRLSPIDIATISRAKQILDEELRRAGIGRLRIELRGSRPPPDLHGGWHHMGTTRMHRDPKQGVVDEHCRLHDVSNLYVAGSSVFPTGGYANPTLTIVALAIRLADHIKAVLPQGS